MNVEDYFDDLVAHEGCVLWMYCDTRGFVTTGIGNLVASPIAAAALPFRHKADLSAATIEEKMTAFARVQDAFDPIASAEHYRNVSDLRLSQDFVRDLVSSRLSAEFVPGITELCPGFDSFPLPARRALVDMAYNLGVGGLGRFHHMIAACNAGDWAEAAAQCHRSSCRDMRNAWTMQMFIDSEVT